MDGGIWVFGLHFGQSKCGESHILVAKGDCSQNIDVVMTQECVC